MMWWSLSVFVCLKISLKHPPLSKRSWKILPRPRSAEVIFISKVWKTTINSVVLIITNTVNYSRKIELNEEMGSRGFPFKFWVRSRIIFLNFRGVVGATFKHLGGTFDFFEKSLSFIAQTFRICLNYKSRKISIIYN